MLRTISYYGTKELKLKLEGPGEILKQKTWRQELGSNPQFVTHTSWFCDLNQITLNSDALDYSA